MRLFSRPASKFRSRRLWAERLEDRSLLCSHTFDETEVPPTAEDDDYSAPPHQITVVLAPGVLENDSDDDPIWVSGVVTPPSFGSLELNSDGSFTYEPTVYPYHGDWFEYQITDGFSTDTAYVNLASTNSSPIFEPIEELLTPTPEVHVEADEDWFFENGAIGQLEATDDDGDVPEYALEGSSQYFAVAPDGTVSIIDGVGLAEVIKSTSLISQPVIAEDGFAGLDMSEFFLAKGTNWIDQSEIVVTTNTGVTHTPDDGAELIALLEQIRTNGEIVTLLIIKGHGSDTEIDTGDAGQLVAESTAVGDANDFVSINQTDVTQLLKDVTDNTSVISLRGCWSHGLARRVKPNLDGAKVYGAIRMVLGIPGTPWGLGVYMQ